MGNYGRRSKISYESSHIQVCNPTKPQDSCVTFHAPDRNCSHWIGSMAQPQDEKSPPQEECFSKYILKGYCPLIAEFIKKNHKQCQAGMR